MSYINACLERKGKEGYGLKEVLSVRLVQATRLKCGDRGAGCCWCSAVAEW